MQNQYLQLQPFLPNLQGYQIIKQIGQGGFATVYLGQDLQNQEFVAIKEIKILRLGKIAFLFRWFMLYFYTFQKQNQDGQVNKYLNKEIQIIQQLIEKGNHNNYSKFIVKYKSFQQVGTSYYIISELCEFGDLYMHMCNFYQQYTFEIKLEFLVEIIQGIEALHKMRVSHRDLKTDNILIAQNKQKINEYYLKITDFGISSLQMENLQSKVGTVVYMAPEIFLQSKYDYKVDIWSFGIIAFEIWKNQLYFPYKSDADTINQIKNYVSYQRGLIESQDIEDVIDLCLQKDPNKRAEASQIREKLMEIQKKQFIQKQQLNNHQNNQYQQNIQQNQPPQQLNQQQQQQQQQSIVLQQLKQQQFEQYKDEVKNNTSKILSFQVQKLQSEKHSIVAYLNNHKISNNSNSTNQQNQKNEASHIIQQIIQQEAAQMNGQIFNTQSNSQENNNKQSNSNININKNNSIQKVISQPNQPPTKCDNPEQLYPSSLISYRQNININNIFKNTFSLPQNNSQETQNSQDKLIIKIAASALVLFFLSNVLKIFFFK